MLILNLLFTPIFLIGIAMIFAGKYMVPLLFPRNDENKFEKLRNAFINRLNELVIPIYGNLIKEWIAPCPQCNMNTVIEEAVTHWDESRPGDDRGEPGPGVPSPVWSSYTLTEVVRFCPVCEKYFEFPKPISEKFQVSSGVSNPGTTTTRITCDSREGYFYGKAWKHAYHRYTVESPIPEFVPYDRIAKGFSAQWDIEEFFVSLGKGFVIIGIILFLFNACKQW